MSREPISAHVDDDEEWSPSDGLAAMRRALVEARAGIAEGKLRFAERQAAYEELTARRKARGAK